MPTLSDLLAEEEHEVTIRRRQVRRRRATESASKVRRSRWPAAKEDPLYTDVTAKATHVKAAQLDLSKASEHMKKVLEQSGVLKRSPPARVPSTLGRVCGLAHLSEVEDDVVG
jgi:outer membrane murein-binding lipoprotein Lpp